MELHTPDLYDIAEPAVQLLSDALNVLVCQQAHAPVGIVREAQLVLLNAQVAQGLTVLIHPCHYLQIFLQVAGVKYQSIDNTSCRCGIPERRR